MIYKEIITSFLLIIILIRNNKIVLLAKIYKMTTKEKVKY